MELLLGLLQQLRVLLVQSGHTTLALVVYAVIVSLSGLTAICVSVNAVCKRRQARSGSSSSRGRTAIQDPSISSTTRQYIRPLPNPPRSGVDSSCEGAEGESLYGPYEFPPPPSPATLARDVSRRHSHEHIGMSEVHLGSTGSTSSSEGEPGLDGYMCPKGLTHGTLGRKKSKKK